MSSLVPTRVLVVDDDPHLPDSIAQILLSEGYAAVAASNAEAALEHLSQNQFDIVLADLRIEGASGEPLITEVQRRWPDMIAVVLTDHESLEVALGAVRAGAYDYLIKPCHTEDLKVTIARAAERCALSHQLREHTRQLDEARRRLRSLSDQFRRRFEEATTELRRRVEVLTEANRNLEEAERRRTHFLSVIAHELNQPLTTISGSVQLLGRQGLPPEVAQRARATIMAETRRLARLVQDLTQASEMATGRFQVQRSTCDLAAIIQEQVDLAAMSEGAPRILVESAIPQAMTMCDRDRIAQVISNLLGNAMKYAPGSEIRISLRAETDRYVISISDQGPGIPPDYLEAIFQAGVQLAESAGAPRRGSGLGLYVARGIVEAHGGRIWASNGERGGTTFTFELPAWSTEQTEPAA